MGLANSLVLDWQKQTGTLAVSCVEVVEWHRQCMIVVQPASRKARMTLSEVDLFAAVVWSQAREVVKVLASTLAPASALAMVCPACSCLGGCSHSWLVVCYARVSSVVEREASLHT